MKLRLLSILLILTMMLSLCACGKADDEDTAEADTSSSQSDSNTDEQNEDEQGDSQDDEKEDDSQEDEGSDSEDEQQSDENESDNEPQDDKEDEKEDDKPSTDGTHTVTYDFDFDNKIEKEQVKDKADKKDADRPGYEFEGWYDGDSEWDFGNDVTGDITLTAKWKLLEYTITYNADGATLPDGNPTTYNIEKGNIELKPATKTGKMFLGWSIKSDSDSNSYTSTSITKGTYGNLEITPVWDENAIIIGKFEQDANVDNGKEDLVWNKLAEKDGKVLVVTRDIIDAQTYDKTGGDNIKWSTCGLRNWLNNSFYATTFSQEEKALIAKTQISTPGKADNSSCEDYIFLPSLEELKEYFASSLGRCAKITAYAKANGAQDSPEGGWWWSRTKISTYGAALVENTGNIRDIGYNVKMTTIGVRPMMWVDAALIK